MTCTPELVPFLSKVRFSRRRTNEAEQVFRRADHRDREDTGDQIITGDEDQLSDGSEDIGGRRVALPNR